MKHKGNYLSFFITLLLLTFSVGSVSARILGDVDNDNSITIVDALKTAQTYVGLSVPDFNAVFADVDGSGAINIVDALIIAQYYVKLIDSFPAVFKKMIPFPYEVLRILDNGTELRSGGFGSSITAHPLDPSFFYGITDRGPAMTYTGAQGKGKKFPLPGLAPTIGLFQLTSDGSINLVNKIILKNPAGGEISGLPNPEGRGNTGEVPYDYDGNVLYLDDYGLDCEGLVAMRNGDFWISDEYGPHIVHFDPEGNELERISPEGIDTGGRKLPAVLKNRRPNRGMEGLTLTPDEMTLVGIMQSTLYNPSKNMVENETLTRIITFELESGMTKQFLYVQEKNWNANSEITALDSNTFLVVERDTKFSGEEAAQKHIYKVDISNATDVSGDIHNLGGMLIGEKTLEQCTIQEIEDAGILVAEKNLVVDLVEHLPYHFPHDKVEGIWLIDEDTIGVVNDDDFAVTTEAGEFIQKVLPGTDIVDRNTLYVINLKV